MSRIGKQPIKCSDKVDFKFENGVVTVKGPLGELKQTIATPHVKFKKEGGEIIVTRDSDVAQVRAMHGLYRQLVANMVSGVEKPFVKRLIVAGVGYKVAVEGSKLVMNIGYSHPVVFEIPQGLKITCPDANTIEVSGIDKDFVGQVAADIKSKRPVEPYHGYGLHYENEYVIRKEGKTAKK